MCKWWGKGGDISMDLEERKKLYSLEAGSTIHLLCLIPIGSSSVLPLKLALRFGIWVCWTVRKMREKLGRRCWLEQWQSGGGGVKRSPTGFGLQRRWSVGKKKINSNCFFFNFNSIYWFN